MATYAPYVIESTVSSHQASADVETGDEWREAVLITIAAALVRLFLATLLSLYPDEAYYWDWSRHLAPGYYDHPPAIAWLIAGGAAVGRLFGGEGSWMPSVRLFAVVAGGVGALFLALIARRLGGGAAARRAAILFAAMPIAASGLVLATPDAPLLAASAATLYCVLRALEFPRNSLQSTMWWGAAGVCLGLSFTSKYTSILIPIFVLVAMAIRPGLRARFLEVGPWLAAVLAFLIFLPVLRWNASHDWISFRFQLGHGLTPARGTVIGRELELIGGQFALVSPILFVLAAVVVWRALRRPLSDAHFLLAAVAIGTFGFFIFSATRRTVEPNWPAVAYLPAMALIAVMVPRHDEWLRRGMGLAGLLSALIYVHAFATILPIKARRDPVARSVGWGQLATAVQDVRNTLSLEPGDTWVAAERYQDVSELAYELQDHPRVFCSCISGRRNQYELWPGFTSSAKAGDNLVLVAQDTSPSAGTPAALAAHFATISMGSLTPLMRGRDTVTVRRIWLLKRYRGGWPKRQD